MVFEMCEDSSTAKNTAGAAKSARKLDFRRALSVDKNGSTATGPDNNDFATGMGWFPGYALNLETGERLNIAFGENSALLGENGNDMKWNPTKDKASTVFNPSAPWDTIGSPVFGGQHYIYVFGHNKENDPTAYSITPSDTVNVPRYDGCKRIRQILGWNNSLPVDQPKGKAEIFRDAMWVNIPLLASGYSFTDPRSIPCDVTVRLRVSKPYKKGYSSAFWVDGATTFYYDTIAPAQNKNLPMYKFSTDGIATHTQQNDLAVSALDLINVVPNPYYAYSAYETNAVDNRIKITNLPEQCTISIYNLSGTLVRRLKQGLSTNTHAALNTQIINASALPTTWDGSLDWDLKNTVGTPIASGVYIIHVEVPGVGERMFKWFGVMRPIDLQSY